MPENVARKAEEYRLKREIVDKFIAELNSVECIEHLELVKERMGGMFTEGHAWEILGINAKKKVQYGRRRL